MSEQDPFPIVPDAEAWLIVKRGLYFRPCCQGYTGIRDQAGRYYHEFAKRYVRDGVTIMRLAEAPEFTEAAYTDQVVRHLQKQRDDALKARGEIVAKCIEAVHDTFSQMTPQRYVMEGPSAIGRDIIARLRKLDAAS